VRFSFVGIDLQRRALKSPYQVRVILEIPHTLFLCPSKNEVVFMLRLFRRKMVSVVKWFQGSHFSENHFPLKAFSGVWRVRKIANIFLYFYSIILTYKNQFLFTT
jgi:hypothetical protein